MNRDPGEIYCELTRGIDEPVCRVKAPVTREQKEMPGKLSPQKVRSKDLSGEKIQTAPRMRRVTVLRFGGVKVIVENGWFAARPSGTEDIYKIYGASLQGVDHLRRILEEAQANRQ